MACFCFCWGCSRPLSSPESPVRMGLAAHSVGLTNGIFLIALGAIWTEVRLGPRAKAIAYWTALYGTYVNWLFTVLAAVFGTGAVSPILAPGLRGQAWQEGLVMAGFVSVFVAMVLWGLRDRALE